MNQEQLKNEVHSIMEDLLVALEEGGVNSEEWRGISLEAAEIARTIQRHGNRVASYAGVAMRQHNRQKAKARQ